MRNRRKLATVVILFNERKLLVLERWDDTDEWHIADEIQVDSVHTSVSTYACGFADGLRSNSLYLSVRVSS